MSRCDNPYNSAQAESVEAVAADLPHFIKGIYNATRQHSALGYLSQNRIEEINTMDGSKSAG